MAHRGARGITARRPAARARKAPAARGLGSTVRTAKAAVQKQRQAVTQRGAASKIKQAQSRTRRPLTRI